VVVTVTVTGTGVFPESVALEGDGTHVAPDGAPLQESVTVPLNPDGVTVTLKVPPCPACTVIEVLEEFRVNEEEAAEIVAVVCAEAFAPLLSVTVRVTLNAPAAA